MTIVPENLEPCESPVPEMERPPTEWSDALMALTADVLGAPEVGPRLDTVLDTIRWMRNNPTSARILIGDLTRGY